MTLSVRQPLRSISLARTALPALALLAACIVSYPVSGAEEETPVEEPPAEEQNEAAVPEWSIPPLVTVTGGFGEDDEGRGFMAEGLKWGDLELLLPGIEGATRYPFGRDGVPFVQAKGALDPQSGHLLCVLNSPVSGNPRVRLRLNLGIYDAGTGEMIESAAFTGHDPQESRRVWDYDFRFSQHGGRLMLATATGAAEVIAAECRPDGSWVKDFSRYPFRPDYMTSTCLMIEDVLPMDGDLIALVSLRERPGFDGGIYLNGFSAKTLRYFLVRLPMRKGLKPEAAELGTAVPMPRFDYSREDKRLMATLEDFGALFTGDEGGIVADVWVGFRVDRYVADRSLENIEKTGRGDESRVPVLAAMKAVEESIVPPEGEAPSGEEPVPATEETAKEM